MQWQSCPPEPLAWIELREGLLGVLHTPVLFLPLMAAIAIALAWRLRLPRAAILALGLLLPMALSAIYSSTATAVLSAWLQAQVPSGSPLAGRASGGQPVVVLVGRGPVIAAATSEAAAAHLRQGSAVAVYVSGDRPETAERLVHLGVPSEQVAGDSCARTTWENATLTAAWLGEHHPGAPVVLITDPWQLPRAARAFAVQGLQVMPQAAEPVLSPAERNRLALRETAATLLYRLQGRI